MDVLFYLHASIAVFAMGMAMFTSHAIHALLYAVLSLLSLAVSMYILSAPLAAALEVIVYAGAIIVLFVFAVMLLNQKTVAAKHKVKKSKFIVSFIVFAIFWADISFVLSHELLSSVSDSHSVKDIVVGLFSGYGLLIELISFVLLAGLIAAVSAGESFMSRARNSLRSHS